MTKKRMVEKKEWGDWEEGIGKLVIRCYSRRIWMLILD
jgi:hypothetical protein